jgi:hypothetical protein
MPTLTVVYGGDADNAYVSVSDATTIIYELTFNTDAWDNSSTEMRERSLLMASNQIDSLKWAGAKFYWNQSLLFPRTPPGVDHPIGILGTAATSSSVFTTLLEHDYFQKRMKKRIEKACTLQAYHLLQQREAGGLDQRHKDLQRSGVLSWSRSVAGISESYSYSKSQVLVPDAWEQLYHYKGTIRISRGDEQSIEFE